MNKDLEVDSAIWRALFGVRVAAFAVCLHVVKEPPKMVLRRILCPSLETGAVFDAALSGNYGAIAIRVSVTCGTGVCDEKGWKAGSGSGAPPAYRSPLWLGRGEGVSEEFQAVGEREKSHPKQD
jgi:hypothetical protein